MPEWTKRQEQAITARNRDILVSAAAGSGKTAVLIERVMSLLREGKQLENMLVMTFTHAAADEMKERLTALLSREAGKDEHLRKQFMALGRADISTLHSFCGRLLRKHFQAADTDPLSRQMDEAQADELFEQALDEAVDALHEEPETEALGLFERFTEEEILSMVRALYRFLMAMDNPFEWLDTSLLAYGEGSLYAHPWYGLMLREAGLLLSGALDLARQAEALCLRPDGPARYLDAVRDDLALVQLLGNRLHAPEPFVWDKPQFTRLSTRKAPEAEDPALALLLKDGLRERLKKLVNQALELLPKNPDEAAKWMEGLRETAPQLRALAALTKDTSQRYQALKAARAVWDFNDLEHLSLQALQDPLVRKEVSARYEALFVDEYQDISRTQEAIIRALRGENTSLFMVGDVKQSIYRFRLADPGLFLGKFRRFSQDHDASCRLITLKENFRSDPNILKAVNLVFEYAMREKATEIDYDEEARLSTLSQKTGDALVELHLLSRGGGEAGKGDSELINAVDQLRQGEAAENEEEGEAESPADAGLEAAFVYEARLMAERVEQLVNQEGVRYRDIAILMRSAVNRASVLAEILNARGIPTYSDAEGEFFSQSEVRDSLNILRVLDNPLQDEPLLGALSCPAFAYTPDELAELAVYAKAQSLPLHRAFMELAKTQARHGEALDRLSRWRLMAQTMPLQAFLQEFLRESGLYAVAGAREEGVLRRANLRILVSRATASTEPMNLSDFVERLRRAQSQNLRDRSASLGMQEDVVRIMTLHKSKGLQFPVVFLPNLAASFAHRPGGLPLRMDAATGLALTHINPKLRAKNDGFGMRALRAKKQREELSEEARLLYVGMTRAKHRLILLGTIKPGEAPLPLPPGDYAAAGAGSMLDWVRLPLAEALARQENMEYEAPGGSRWLLNYRQAESLPEVRLKKEAAPLDFSPEGLVPPSEAPFTPPFVANNLPLQLKSSVTGLILRQQERDEEETPEVKRRPLPDRDEPPRLRPQKPAGLTGAQRGAAAHKALCALDPAAFAGLEPVELWEKLRPALDQLAQRGLLSAEEREALELGAVARFYESGLARRLAGSPERHAEWAFTLLAEHDLLLQGVVDACFVEDGAWVLLDYKTDYGEPAELLSRYTPQMRWYMRALRDITGMPVKEAWLYLLRPGQAMRVEEDAPITLNLEDVDALRGR